MSKRYRDPSGRLLIWPTFLRLIGDLCAIWAFLGIVAFIYAITSNREIFALTFSIVVLVVFSVLMRALHNAAEKSAARKIQAWYERHEA